MDLLTCWGALSVWQPFNSTRPGSQVPSFGCSWILLGAIITIHALCVLLWRSIERAKRDVERAWEEPSNAAPPPEAFSEWPQYYGLCCHKLQHEVVLWIQILKMMKNWCKISFTRVQIRRDKFLIVQNGNIHFLHDTFYKMDILSRGQTACELKCEWREAHSMTFKGMEKKGWA